MHGDSHLRPESGRAEAPASSEVAGAPEFVRPASGRDWLKIALYQDLEKRFPADSEDSSESTQEHGILARRANEVFSLHKEEVTLDNGDAARQYVLTKWGFSGEEESRYTLVLPLNESAAGELVPHGQLTMLDDKFPIRSGNDAENRHLQLIADTFHEGSVEPFDGRPPQWLVEYPHPTAIVEGSEANTFYEAIGDRVEQYMRDNPHGVDRTAIKPGANSPIGFYANQGDPHEGVCVDTVELEPADLKAAYDVTENDPLKIRVTARYGDGIIEILTPFETRADPRYTKVKFFYRAPTSGAGGGGLIQPTPLNPEQRAQIVAALHNDNVSFPDVQRKVSGIDSNARREE